MGYRLGCSKVRGIVLHEGSNLCPLQWPVDSYPLYHPNYYFLWAFMLLCWSLKDE